MEYTLNGLVTEQTSVPISEAENNENPFSNDSNTIVTNNLSNEDNNSFADSEGGFGGIFGDPLAPDEGYEYNLGEDSGLPMRTPFDQLLEFEEFNNLGDIFKNVDPSDNPFAIDASSEGSPINTDGNVSSTGSFSVPEEMSFGRGSSMNADFSGVDTGTNNTDSGNGNNFISNSEGESGSNNQANGNGNWFYGNENIANGNGNWNLNAEGGTPFDSIFKGENNPLTGGNPLGFGEEGGIPTDAIGGNNPIFSGGSTTPTPVGEGEIPDTAESPTGNRNIVNGNGNWNFGSDNDISGNGNWNFGDGNFVDNGNGNWNLGDDNEVNGNGNRPSGNNNSISGNSNRVTGDGNSISGNRFELDENDLNILGNADRYFQTDTDGNVSLLSDESKSDPNRTFDFDGVVDASVDNEVDELLNESELFEDSNLLTDQDVIDLVYQSMNVYMGSNSVDIGSSSNSGDVIDNAAGIFAEGEVPTDISPDALPVS